MGRVEATGAAVATVVALIVVLSVSGVIVCPDGSTAVPARSGASETVVEHQRETQTSSPNEMRVDAVYTPTGSAAASETARLSGQVTDENGDPIFDATVAVDGGTRQTTTASDGYYDLEIEPGTNEIVISADNHQPKTVTVNVSSGGWQRLDVTLSFKPTSVVGTVTGANGTPIENATVAVVDTATETVTDNNGTYQLDVDPGTNMLEASADGYENWRTVVSVPEHETVEQNFTLAVPEGDEANETVGNESDGDETNESDGGGTNESDDRSDHEPRNETDESPTEPSPTNESDTESPNESRSRSESNGATAEPPSLREQLHQLLLLSCLFLAVLVTTTVAGLYWNRTYEP